MPNQGTKKIIPAIMPKLYKMGAKAVTKNLWKTCKIPLIILLAPKIIGPKNIIRISITVNSFFSSENPGAIKEMRIGAKIMRIIEIPIKTLKKTFKKVEMYCQASSFDFTQYELKMGIMAADMAPNIKIRAIRSGRVKA